MNTDHLCSPTVPIRSVRLASMVLHSLKDSQAELQIYTVSLTDRASHNAISTGTRGRKNLPLINSRRENGTNKHGFASGGC